MCWFDAFCTIKEKRSTNITTVTMLHSAAMHFMTSERAN